MLKGLDSVSVCQRCIGQDDLVVFSLLTFVLGLFWIYNCASTIHYIGLLPSISQHTEQTAIYAAESASPDAITRRQTYERLHTLLSSLIYLIPTLPATLWPVLNKHFPHKRESRNSQVVYISNALRVVEYCPQLGEHVLTAVIVRALQIDVSYDLLYSCGN